jgi:hypothetical protein
MFKMETILRNKYPELKQDAIELVNSIRKELYVFKIEESENINLNLRPLIKTRLTIYCNRN